MAELDAVLMPKADWTNALDATREKGGTTALLTSGELAQAIRAIPTGGPVPVIQPLEVTENGDYTAPPGVDGYSPVSVNVPSGGGDTTTEDKFVEGTLEAYYNPRVKEIGENVFKQNRSIRTFEFSNVTVVKDGAFDSCHAETIVIPKLQNAMYAAFSGCSYLVDVQVNSPISTGFLAFNGCKKLNPKHTLSIVGEIKQWVFRGCSELQSINVKGVTVCGWSAFEGCSKIERLDFDNLIAFDDIKALSKCESLTTFINRSNNVCNLKNANNFEQTPIASGTGYIYVPKSLVEQYKAATNWVTYAAQIRAIEDYPDITGG